MLIRPANEQDYAAICQLVKSKDELFLVYPRGTFPLSPDQVAELARIRIDLTVIDLAGQIVGFANLYDFEPARTAFIGNVVVDSNQRGKGLGKLLISHMLDLAQNKYGLPKVNLSVFSYNTLALLFYGRLGFVPYGIEERVDPNGKTVALIHMQKDL